MKDLLRAWLDQRWGWTENQRVEMIEALDQLPDSVILDYVARRQLDHPRPHLTAAEDGTWVPAPLEPHEDLVVTGKVVKVRMSTVKVAVFNYHADAQSIVPEGTYVTLIFHGSHPLDPTRHEGVDKGD